jgi:hypothetical protein
MAAAVPVIITAAVAALGAGAGAVVQYQQAKTNQKVLDAQARAERRTAFARERAARRAGQLTLKRQQLAIAKAGLLNEGSPLEQLARNAFEVEYEALSIRNAGLDRAANLRWQGHVEKQAAHRNIGVAIATAALTSAAGSYAKFGGGTTPSSQSGAGLLTTSNNYAVAQVP